MKYFIVPLMTRELPFDSERLSVFAVNLNIFGVLSMREVDWGCVCVCVCVCAVALIKIENDTRKILKVIKFPKYW